MRRTARNHSVTGAVVTGVAGAILVGWSASRAIELVDHPGNAAFYAYLGLELYLVFQVVTTIWDRPRQTTPAEAARLAQLEVVALVPCFNEAPGALQECLESLLDQSRPLQAISVVDDGSTESEYAAQRLSAGALAEEAGVRFHWQRTANHGKRVAQSLAAQHEPTADIYLTVDSDSQLDPRAIEEGLKPFADPSVQSVAGVVLSSNVSRNLLTRSFELMLVTWQLVERSSATVFGSVLVNSGCCAFYRGSVLRSNLAEYVGERFAGRPVSFSDDSFLTLFALRAGRTVQQRTCFAFAVMPERFSHHARQQFRWARGSYIRSLWRFRYLPMRTVGYWMHLWRWLVNVTLSAVLLALVFSGAFANAGVIAWSIVVIVCLQLALSAKYLTIERSDQTRAQHWGVYALTPIAAMWAGVVIRLFRVWALFTVAQLGWGTRQRIEVPGRAEGAG